METDVDRFVRADLIVEGRLVAARRKGAPGAWLYLDATFLVEEKFKGGVAKGRKIVVSRSCRNGPVPREFLGYPQARDYCPGSEVPRITGVDASGGGPGPRPEAWILHLERSIEPGRWHEIRPGAYGDCGKTRGHLSPADQRRYDRLSVRAAELRQ
jgi:hypothetical protein